MHETFILRDLHIYLFPHNTREEGVRPPEGEHNLLDLSLPLRVWCTIHIKNEYLL